MIQKFEKYATRENERHSFRFADDVNSAIKMIFDAFENTPLHDEAVRLAKEKATESLIGEQRNRALAMIEQLGSLMDREHWQK